MSRVLAIVIPVGGLFLIGLALGATAGQMLGGIATIAIIIGLVHLFSGGTGGML